MLDCFAVRLCQLLCAKVLRGCFLQWVFIRSKTLKRMHWQPSRVVKAHMVRMRWRKIKVLVAAA